ncbi:hypothetical protein PUMCH_005131 [Australozyma saopauloensis]|uniref:Phosphatidylethanolamine N-methyltransferase n=1 Tax=Australozyma saopauloensis TaxID=291208 RepID=A0AAX4HGH7_9ASCO|nr:hypothetical protein PUMCH_005131 [[Candida] saopauloensis]
MSRKGITFNGETFAVPETHDMVKTLFDPTVRKSMFESVIIVLLVANSLVFYFVADSVLRIRIFVGMYIFWRLCYNFGIGYLLNQQSNRFRLVEWSKKLNLFAKDQTSFVGQLVQTEVQTQMGSEYKINKHPVDFNTWLIFRKVVDLILMQDFTTFVCLFVACCIYDDNQFIHGQPQWLTAARMIIGVSLIVFNFWVKVNAHNTIKDYAWYWGDFFFRQINNEDLIFDGVFEMFPHPMYSVGYIGYYGFAMIAKSYTVLVCAVFGHFLQMVFLHYIENPHIDKIYGPDAYQNSLLEVVKLKDLTNFDNSRPLVGLTNFNVWRASDFINLVNVFTYAVLIPSLASIAGSNVEAVGKILFYLTVMIKAVECVSINALLGLQSKYKLYTRWFLSNNIPIAKSLNNFAVMYNSMINLTYASFFGMNLYRVTNWHFTSDLFITSHFFLRLFLGLVLILTQVWINASIIDSIGYFGWFYGDFFLPKSTFMPQRAHLTKAGIYRYLNNPEQIFSACGVMGATLIIPTYENIVLCVFWVLGNFIRINFIEKSHMIKIYGELEVFQDSGVTKTVKKHLLPDLILRKFTVSDSSRKRTTSMFMDSFDSFVKDLRTKNDNTSSGLSKEDWAQMSQSKFFLNSEYHLEVKNLQGTESQVPFSHVGDVLEVSFSAPKEHSSKDWIGLYKVAQTSFSRYKTLISSNNRWVYTGETSSDVVKFSGDRLFWEDGVYEFRYHIDGKHDVAYVSEPFEIKCPVIEVPCDEGYAAELADDLRKNILNKVVDGVNDNNTPIYEGVLKSSNILESYTRIARLISRCTGLNVNKRFLIYNDNESSNKFTAEQLAIKLIHIQNALDELQEDDLQAKKEQ